MGKESLLWLDKTMSYSCGYFTHEDDTLYQAQVNKVDYILKKLHLQEGMNLLDTVNKVLKPSGVCLLHFISALKENPGDPWIKKYIFPGGVVPSLREIISCAATFHNGIIDLHQILMTKGINNELPLVRWY